MRGKRLHPDIALCAIWLLLATDSGLAQSGKPYSTETDLLQELPVVSAVSRFEQQLEAAPASVTVIDRELIELSGARTFADIFRLVPGMRSYYINNNRYGVSYHGIGREFPNQLEVTIDGRSVYESLFASVHWGTLGIDLADIDYIEVVRGSNAPAQGSNAFLGAVNIVTRKPFEYQGLTAQATMGDLSTRDGTLSYGGKLGTTHYRLSLGYDHNSGFPAVDGEGPMEDGVESYHANFRSIVTPTLSDTLDLSLGYAYQRLGWGDGDRPDEFSQSRFDYQFQSLNWSRDLAGEDALRVQAYHSRLRARNRVPLGPVYQFIGIDATTAQQIAALDPVPPALVADFAARSGLDSGTSATLLDNISNQLISGFGTLQSERYDIEISHQVRPGRTIQGVWGIGSRWDKLEYAHPQSTDQEATEHYLRLFGHTEWQALPRLTVNVGAMVEDTFVGSFASPRFGANLRLDDHNTLRIGIARGHRVPSLQEANERTTEEIGDLIYNIFRVSDPDLKEETIDSYEVGYLLHWNDPAIKLDVRIFREEIEDVIDEVEMPTSPPTLYFDDEVKTYENVGSWTLQGAEFELSYRPWQRTLIRLHYSNTEADSRLLRNRMPVHYRTIDRRMVRHSGGLLIGHSFTPAWSASVFSYHQSEVRWEDGNTIDDFTRVDAQVTYRFSLGSSRGHLRVVAQNLGGDYPEFNINNRFETRLFLEARVNLP
jgi:iron complex outermembrane receptor protein